MRPLQHITRSSLILLSLLLFTVGSANAQVWEDDSYYAQFDSVARAQDSLSFQTFLVDTAAVDTLAYSRATRVFAIPNYPLAAQYLQDYTSRFPESPQTPNAYFLLGQCELNIGNRDAGRIYLLMATGYGSTPFYAEAHKLLAPIHKERGEYREAMQAYRIGASATQTPAELHAMRREALNMARALEDHKLIVETADELINTPGVPEGLINFGKYQRAFSLLQTKQYDRAFDDFFTIAKMNDALETAAEARYRLVEIRYLQKRWSDVERLTLAAARVNTPFQYWVAKGYILMARGLEEQGRKNEAVTTLRSLINGYANDTDGIKEEAGEGIKALVMGTGKW